MNPDSFSQFGEDRKVLELFNGQIGQFIDIGASGGVSLSNSFALLRAGWKGLLVEPSPIHFQTLLMNHRYQAGAMLVNAAVWTERRMMQFNLDATWYSTLKHREEGQLPGFIGSYYIPTMLAADLKDIMDHADFISIDTEEADLDIFPSLVAAYPGCRLWCVEHGKVEAIKERWGDLFTAFRMKIVMETPENYLVEKKV